MNKYKHVPANLTVDTFIDRVRAGEVFYDKSLDKYHYDNSCNNPFRLGFRLGLESLSSNWAFIAELTTRVETTWEDEVSEENPILCWASNESKHKSKLASLITGIDVDGEYIDSRGNFYTCATPVLPSECRSID